MEEILASIRRIIADDDSLPGARREREARRQDEAAAESATAAQNAYPAPVLEPAPQPAAPARPAPVADIRQLRVNRAPPEPVTPDPVMQGQSLHDQALQDPVMEEPVELEYDYAVEPELTEPLFAEEDVSLQAYESADSAPLVSAEAASSIASHFQALATSMFINDSGLMQKYAQEMMRPMLKQWLDDNLPVIVERLVRAEIERVARGGRR